MDALIYGESAARNSPPLPSLKDLEGNPILLLVSTSRIAFVLHHVLGYKLREGAAMLQMDETEYRRELRSAYLQLAACQFEKQVLASNVIAEAALA